MPTDLEIQASIDALLALWAQPGVRRLYTSVVRIYWGAPDGTKDYAFTLVEQMRDPLTGDLLFPNLVANFPDVLVRLITPTGAPFLDLPKTAAIGDDKVTLNVSDLDGEISRLCWTYGQGIRVQVFSYYPQVDLVLSEFQGALGAPKDADGVSVKLEVTIGFRSPNLLLPRRLPSASCQFIFGGLLSSLAEVAEHKGCPYNVHVGGSVGVPGFTDCPRNNVTVCSARLATTRYWPGFNTVIESIPNNQTKGPNLLATTRGNDSSLTDPIRVIIGSRWVKALRLLAYRPENNTRNPAQGFVAALWEVCEGTVENLRAFYMNNISVSYEHLNFRFGQLGQAPSAFSPNINTYSGTAVAFGRIQGDFRNVDASGLSAHIVVDGLVDIKSYTDFDTYVESYSQAPVWGVLRMLTDKRWGFGDDETRYNIQSAIDTAAWHAETVAFHDPNGNLFTGTRNTFDIELNARATQQQIYDACVASRMAVPFEFEGEKYFRALKKETIDSTIPVFTTVGPDANICAGSDGRAQIKWSYVGDDQLVNQVVVNFDDALNFGTNTPLTFGDQLQQLKAGKAWGDRAIRVISKSYPALGTVTFAQAARLGNLLLYLGPLDSGGIKNNFRAVYTTWFTYALRLKPYDLVQLVVPELEALWAANPDKPRFDYFRILKINRKANLQVELEVQAYPVDFYAAMEDVLVPPPLPAGGYTPNIGGLAHNRAGDLGFGYLQHTNDQLQFQMLS